MNLLNVKTVKSIVTKVLLLVLTVLFKSIIGICIGSTFSKALFLVLASIVNTSVVIFLFCHSEEIEHLTCLADFILFTCFVIFILNKKLMVIAIILPHCRPEVSKEILYTVPKNKNVSMFHSLKQMYF